MALRQVSLATAKFRPSGAQDLNLVRFSYVNVDHESRSIDAHYKVGRLLGGAFVPSPDSVCCGHVFVSGDAFAEYLAEGAGSAGQDEAQQDWLLQRAIDSDATLAGTKGDY